MRSVLPPRRGGAPVTRIIQLVVPWALLAVFLYRARIARVFLLGIPFLMFMGPCVFFDHMRLFNTPRRLPPYALLTLWLILVWAVATGRLSAGQQTRLPDLQKPQARGVSLRLWEYALLLILVLTSAHVAVRFLGTADLGEAVGGGLPMLCMVLGYFLVRDIVAHSTRQAVVSFLATVVVANTVATVLFILHQGFHLHIYTVVEHFSTVVNGQLITRTFWFAPRVGLVILALAFVLTRRRWSIGWLLVLLITVIGVWISYTRTLLLVSTVTVMLSILVPELKRFSADRLVRRVLVSVAAVVALLICLIMILPTQSTFFAQRLSGLSGSGGATHDPSYYYRSTRLKSTVKILQQNGSLGFGEGFPTAADNPHVTQVDAWGPDMEWVLVLFAFGIAGVLAFAAVFVGSGMQAFGLLMRNEGEGESLGVMYFIAVVVALLTTAISWSFMQPGVAAMGLWLFAFVGAEARREWSLSTVPVAAGAVEA